MNHFAAALMSSLKSLVIDPEDPIGKQTMARVSITETKSYLLLILIFY